MTKNSSKTRKSPTRNPPDPTKEITALKRQLEVEAALERVRARTMALQHSDELADASFILVQQVRALGIETWGCAFNIWDENSDSATEWFSTDEGMLTTYTQKRKGIFKKYYDIGKSGETLHIEEFKGAKCKKHYDYMCSLPVVGDALAELQQKGVPLPTYQLDNVAYFKYGYVLFVTFKPVPEAHDIFRRFAKVFEQTYIRFLDLKKAEEQAREGQIEAALERVRARAMAMRSSDELADVAELLYGQLFQLGIDSFSCGYVFIKEEKDLAEVWMTDPTGNSWGVWTVPLSEEKVLKDRHNSWKRKKKIHRSDLQGQDLIDHLSYIAKHTPLTSDEAEDFATLPGNLVLLSAHFSYGYLLVVSKPPITKEDENMFIRFAQVFEMTYRRYLDLKKAEEQAREAQIEAALERVRARTMAMHKGDELADTALLLFDQITELGIKPRGCGFLIMDKETKSMQDWSANINEKGKASLVTGTLSFDQHPILSGVVDTWEKGKPCFIGEVHGKELQKYYKAVTSKESTSKSIQDKVLSKYTSEWTNSFYFQYGMMYALTPYAISQEEIEILLRFAQVFKLTYRRFLDLKKAEEQAREAQIEAALERVRSRTMAMQHSSELADASLLLAQQVKALGIETWGCAFHIYDKDASTATEWFSNAEEALPTYKLKLEKIFLEYYQAGQRGESLYIKEFKGKACQKHYQYLCTLPVVGEALLGMKANGIPFPTFQIDHVAYFKYGHLLFITFEPVPQAHSIFTRMASVFEQIYIRFLDLTKAEEQAREAQVEAALERIRNRTLLMRDSSELNEAVAVFFQEFQTLGLLPEEARTYFCHISGDTDMAEVWMTRSDGSVMPGSHHTPLTKSASMSRYYQAWKAGEPIIERNYTGKALIDYLEFVSSLPHVKKDRDYQKIFRSPPEQIVMTDANFLQGNIGIMTFQPLSEIAKDMLVRFAKVFEFTYTRFLDLKKSEEQARKAQIEASLERVRAKAMAMHNSQDLVQTVGQLFKELNSLDISLLRCGVGRVHKATRVLELYTFTGTTKGDPVPVVGNAVLKGHPVLDGCFEHWERQKEYHPVLKGVALKRYYQQIKANYKLPGKQDSKVQYGYFFPFRVGVLFTYTETEFSEEELAIFRKFSSVVGLTYRRYLDLMEAEEQAREAQIEAALERVRAAAMAMHDSQDIGVTTSVMFNELRSLGIKILRTGVSILDQEERSIELWMSKESEQNDIVQVMGKIPAKANQVLNSYFTSWQKGEEVWLQQLSGTKLKQYYESLGQHYYFPEKRNRSQKEYMGGFFFSNGGLNIVRDEPISDEVVFILQRFAGVFDLTYRRFLDLKKAEEQAREAQIEAALERVRAAAMAMHASEDLFSVVKVLHDQLANLGQKEFESSIIHIYPSNLPDIEVWYSYRSVEGKQKQVVNHTTVSKDACDWTRKVMELYDSKEKSYIIESRGKMLKDWYQVMANGVAPDVIEYHKNGRIIVPTVLYYHFSKFSGGALLMISSEPPAEEAKDMQQRAANVFDLAYRRFLDLQKAEKQAREAQIEAALERVRASTMAMHSSEDVGKATNILFQELEGLGIETLRCGVLIIKENQTMEVWAASTFTGDAVFNVAGIVDMTVHPLFRKLFNDWKAGNNIFTYELKGKDAIRYYDAIRKLPSYELPKHDKLAKRHVSTAFLFKEGALFAFTEDSFSEESSKIFQKFTNVFTLTYRRYLDLKEAEARAAAAVLESSLDRVRAEIASMRTPEDLQRITPLVWKELRSLGVPFFRCGVFIMDEPAQTVHMYLSTPSGEPLAALDLRFNEDELPLVRDAIDNWKTQTVHKTHWSQRQFQKFTESLKNRGLITSLKAYQQGEKPPKSLNLHQVPFKQGMLYVGSSEVLEEDQIELVQSLADAFSVAYARYEDFVQLEQAKHSIENALTELKAAQDQLIHSEKMASLGELTAGIAHEIQNPLNFVNNFSEVSEELIEELKEEIQAGNLKDALEIGEDLIQNIEKIHHHGQRASSIVRGMLQHSRASSDEKQLTDINALADEYLRLAYHGFRAKDKSFKASYQTDLQKNLPKIEVVPQDIGRVLLNLINNAFQAVSAKALAKVGGDYNPEVVVTTKHGVESIEISVKDNGSGIPENIRDKIFQPFFTTKAAGEGTGLGLSLSYDIVTKGHGGTIDVRSEAGKGTEFFIRL